MTEKIFFQSNTLALNNSENWLLSSPIFWAEGMWDIFSLFHHTKNKFPRLERDC